jgi:hypothetical protein
MPAKPSAIFKGASHRPYRGFHPLHTYHPFCYYTYMLSKLTLSVDPEVVARAKKYAERNHTSVSELVQTYLSIVTKPPKPEAAKELPPVLASLRSLVKDEGLDYREEYRKHLTAKHS